MDAHILSLVFVLISNIPFGYAQSIPDPFVDLKPGTELDSRVAQPITEPKWSDNLYLKREVLSQFSYGPSTLSSEDRIYSRQSLGGEILKKFSTASATIGAIDIQGRLVRRDNFIPVVNDQEGMERSGWYGEYHNLYLDLYDVFGALLPPESSAEIVGKFNLRIGRYYLPFGYNQQLDTHGTVLQLSNELNFGFERDWMAGLWGTLTPILDYNLSYLVGSGYELNTASQGGLAAGRVSTNGRFINDTGFGLGGSFIIGERLASHMMSSTHDADFGSNIETKRIGLDGRFQHLVYHGTGSVILELSKGEDEHLGVDTQLVQLDYLHRSRRWGASGQLRRKQSESSESSHDDYSQSYLAEVTWYFNNEISNSNLEWVKLNLERREPTDKAEGQWVTTLQYYKYW